MMKLRQSRGKIILSTTLIFRAAARLLFVTSLLLIGISLNPSIAHADTYNFFFKEKSKNGKGNAKANTPNFSITDEPGSPNTSPARSVPLNPLTEPAYNIDSKNEGQTNGLENDKTPALPPSSQVGPPPAIVTNGSNQLAVPELSNPRQAANEQTFIATDDAMVMPLHEQSRPSPVRFGGFIGLYNQDPGRLPSQIKTDGVGLSLSLAHCRPRGLNINFYAGRRRNAISSNDQYYFGGELEIMFIRTRSTEFELPKFEAGLIIGASTLAAHRDNYVSGHTGIRTILNFNNRFGVSLIGRANLGYLVGEAGIVTRI